MGRTAAAFLVLVAVGGCVADDQGPLAPFPTAKQGQPTTAPSYATWSRSPDQFADLQSNRAGRDEAEPPRRCKSPRRP